MTIVNDPSRAELSLALEFDKMLSSNFAGYVPFQTFAQLQEIAIKEKSLPAFDSPISSDLSPNDHVIKDMGPPNNMGPNYQLPPLFLPRCEKIELEVVFNKTILDWVAFTSFAPVDMIYEVLKCLWPTIRLTKSTAGLRGYPCTQAIIVDEVQFGLLGSGAEHGRNSVTLTGTACKTMDQAMVEALYEGLHLLDARLSRVDIALDLYRGEMTFDYAKFAYENGEFKPSKGGIQPQTKTIESKDSSGGNAGRTLYLGQRDGFLYSRIYEKGLEVFSGMTDLYKAQSTERELQIISDSSSDFVPTIADTWLRLECEYKRKDKTRELELRMLIHRDEYFAGAYPFFAKALGFTDGIRPKTLQSDVKNDLEKMMNDCRRSYGPLAYSLREIGFSDSDIIHHIIGQSHSRRLVKSGIFSIAQSAFDAAVPYWVTEPAGLLTSKP